MTQKRYTLELDIRLRDYQQGGSGLEVRNSYNIEAEDLLSILKIMAELEAYTRKIAVGK